MARRELAEGRKRTKADRRCASVLAEKGIPAVDLVAACSGFIYGLAAAHAHMQISDAQYILLVGVDTLSRLTDYSDRSTAVLFGDGAGAVVLKRVPPEENGVLFTRMGADGSGREMIWATGGLNRPRSAPPGFAVVWMLT